jgi:hypothetical protein
VVATAAATRLKGDAGTDDKDSKSSGNVHRFARPLRLTPRSLPVEPYSRRVALPLKEGAHRLLLSALDDAVDELCQWLEDKGPPSVVR